MNNRGQQQKLFFGAVAGLIAVGLLLSAPRADARIDLSILQRDGYGVVELKRPQPNVLTVQGTINDRRVTLVVDTGWAGHGITLSSECAKAAKIVAQGEQPIGKSASGKDIAGVKRGTANKVSLGNVEMRQVPVLFGDFGGLSNPWTRRSLGAVDGFIGAGFLRTCSGIVDLHNLRLYLRPPGTGHRAMLGAAMHGVGLAEARFAMDGSSNCVVGVEINGVATDLFLDTGATFAAIDPRFAPKLDVAAYSSRVGAVDAAGAVTETKLIHLKSFRIGGVPVRAPDLRVQSFGFYAESKGKITGLLGMDILGPNGTLIDFGAQRLYFIPAQ